MHVDRRLLGWGLFFIVLGAVPLAVRAGAVDAEIVGRWPLLWPFILVGLGASLLLRGTPVPWLGGAVMAVTFGLMGGGAIATGFGGVSGFGGCGGGSTPAFEPQRGTLARSGRVSIEFDCGTLRVTTEPAPTSARSPISTPPSMVALLPMEAPRRTTVRSRVQSSSVWGEPSGRVARGRRSFMNMTPWPTKTSSSISTPSQTNVWLEILQRAPMRAPFCISTKVPMRVSSPTRQPYRFTKP